MKYITLVALILLVFSRNAKAQLIDNTSTFRNVASTRYFRFHYDNDYFTKSDVYYSQGIALDYVSPGISRFIAAKLLWKPYASVPQYGLSLNLFAYTPTSIASDAILYGDRPFNADITLKMFMVQPDAGHKQQVSTAFSFGVMGPWALGHEIQYGIHKWLHNRLPHGWQNQVQNDVIVNYQLTYEKQVLSAGNAFLLNAAAEARAGTLNNKASAGFNFMAGRFNKRFVSVGTNKAKTEYYLFAQSRLNGILYDGSMQGGLFNRSSPYVIAARDISRVTFQADAGAIINFKRLYLSYTQSFLTKEFRTGKYHRWGGISLGFAL